VQPALAETSRIGAPRTAPYPLAISSSREELDQEIGDLKARLVLRFVLKEIAPSAYNQAVFDVKKHLGDVLDEIEGVCFEPEFGYWKKRRRPKGADSP